MWKFGLILSVVVLASCNEPAQHGVKGIITAASVEFADVSAAVDSASDGDTVVVPTGTANWSQQLKVEKGIVLQGQTTTSGGGTKDATANDQTIIVDEGPAAPDLITFATDKPFRLTGFTFRAGANPPSGSAHAAVGIYPKSGNVGCRIDNLHFDSLKRRAMWIGGWGTGVVDNVVIRTQGHNQSFYFEMPAWNNKTMGNGSWADYPWFGTDKFYFVEDTSVLGNKDGKGGNVDNMNGARFVIRHSYFRDCAISGHGTESGPQRGNRCAEIYNCIFDWVTTGVAGGQGRSGTFIWHDNEWPTNGPANNSNVLMGLSAYREHYRAKYWGFAQGTNPLDTNVTEDNGTFVEGHAPKVFESGSATGASVKNTNNSITFTDTAKHWTVNQWAGYSVSNMTTKPYEHFGVWILSNTENSITYINNWASDVPQDQWVKFVPGETYSISQVVTALDQAGVGKGDLMENVNGDHVINTTTGETTYPHQQREPCFAWNNIVTPTGVALGFHGQYSIKEGRDYVNLGVGLPVNQIPAQVMDVYVSAVNGVAYDHEFTYPHPLRGGGGSPTPISTGTPHPSVSPPHTITLKPGESVLVTAPTP